MREATNGIKFRVRRTGGGWGGKPTTWEGEVSLPMMQPLDPRAPVPTPVAPSSSASSSSRSSPAAPSRQTFRARGSSRGQALRRTVETAANVLRSPVLSALIPPQVSAGLGLMRSIGRGARRLGIFGLEDELGGALPPRLRSFAKACE